MSHYVTLAEAASYLGVSKMTLRNWDKEGKLKAHRHPLNRYRVYDLDDLRRIRPQAFLLPELEKEPKLEAPIHLSDSRSIKRIINRLHSLLRDNDGNSSIIQRFDELSKLLFLKLIAERRGAQIFEHLQKETPDQYVKRIKKLFKQKSNEYPELIEKKFSVLNLSDSAIINCGDLLANISFEGINLDIKGVLYEEIIKNTFDKSDHQQFFTPHTIVKFIVSILHPFLSEVICDPACGTGGFLAEVKRSGLKFKSLLGLEIDERLTWVSRINLLLHGVDQFRIEHLNDGGSLGPKAKKYFGKVNAIVTNPPFGSDFSDIDILQKYKLGKGKTSRRRGILFIERCWSFLKDGGILGIVIDEGVLNLPSSIDVRKFILDHFDILAICNLPETAFMPYATVNASILFLKKSNSPRRSTNVFFAKADNVGRKGNGDDDLIYDETGKERLNSDLPTIIETWRRISEGFKILSTENLFVANVTANLQNDESLRLDFRYHHPSRNKSKELLKKAKYPLYSLADLCEERNERVIPSSEMSERIILYTGLANIEPMNGIANQIPTPTASIKSAVKRYEPNDIVFARMRPNLRKIALMSFNEGGYVSPECTVFQVIKGTNGLPIIKPKILAALLRSDLVFGQIMHLIAGIGRPRLSLLDLRKVLIPIPPEDVQIEGIHEFDGRLFSAQELRAKANALLQEANLLEASAVEELANKMIER